MWKGKNMEGKGKHLCEMVDAEVGKTNKACKLKLDSKRGLNKSSLSVSAHSLV